MWKSVPALAAVFAIAIAGSARADELQVPKPPAIPQVQVPPLPSVPAPSLPSAPSAPSPSLSPTQRSAILQRTPASPAPATNRPAASAPAGTPSGESPSPSLGDSSPAGDAARPNSGSERVSDSRKQRAGARRDARRAARLRTVVLRRRGCLAALPEGSLRVLVLRAGIGLKQLRSRERVAAILDLSVHRVGRLERLGMRRLRQLAGHGCSPASGRGTVATPQSELRVLATALLKRSPALHRATATPRGSDDRASEQRSSGDDDPESDAGAVKGETATVRAPSTGDVEDGFALPWPVLALFGLVAAWLGLTRIRW